MVLMDEDFKAFILLKKSFFIFYILLVGLHSGGDRKWKSDGYFSFA